MGVNGTVPLVPRHERIFRNVPRSSQWAIYNQVQRDNPSYLIGSYTINQIVR